MKQKLKNRVTELEDELKKMREDLEKAKTAKSGEDGAEEVRHLILRAEVLKGGAGGLILNGTSGEKWELDLDTVKEILELTLRQWETPENSANHSPSVP